MRIPALSPQTLVILLTFALACGGSTAAERRVAATRFLPSNLETTRPVEGDPRSAKVRIYADPAVRALPHWKEDITEQIDYANQLLQPLLGFKLTVESFKDWARTGTPEDALRELAQTDKAEDVAWVIGYVAPADAASTVMAALGDAQPLGRHVTVRAWADKSEVEALSGRLPDPKDPERDEVISAHRRHKQTVVLLHMLATTLGAITEVDAGWIQHLSYSPNQSTFSNRNRELLLLASTGRLTGDTDQFLARKLAEAIEKSDWGGWVPAAHDQLLATLHNVIDAGKAGKTATDVPTAALDEYKRIGELARQGRTSDALTELDNLLMAYPGNGTLHQLKCDIMLAKPGVADKGTRAACNRVSELAPGDPKVHIAVGEALIRAGNLAEARVELKAAEDKIANLPAGAEEAWRKLISIYVGMGSLSWTDEVIAKAKLETDPAAAQVAQTRARYGIPRGAKFVAPDQEAGLVTEIRKALELIYGSKFGDAERALAAADKKWRGAPGITAARCDLAFRMGQLAAAHAACNTALAADPHDSWALYLLGTLLLRDAGTTPAGIAKLKLAIEVDPELGQAWRTLARAYERSRNKAALAQLAKAYQEKFGQPLPP